MDNCVEKSGAPALRRNGKKRRTRAGVKKSGGGPPSAPLNLDITHPDGLACSLFDFESLEFDSSVGADDDRTQLLLSQVKDKDITELIACGREKLAAVPSGGGAPMAVAASVGADDDRIQLLLSQVKDKDITELIACGREKLAAVPSGGGAPMAVAASGGEVKKEEKVEDKEESDEVQERPSRSQRKNRRKRIVEAEKAKCWESLWDCQE